MSETNPPSSPENPPEQAEDAPPETSSQRTYLADDVTNQPTGEVEQSGPVTTLADHVPSDAVPLLSTKVVAAPPAEPGTPAAVDVQTA
jgi:hypothetical protein